MAENYKHLYEQTNKMLAMYQDEIVPGLRKAIEKMEKTYVEVVRCKECAVPHNKWTGCPKLNGLVPPPDFYCAYGERKDNE